MLAWRNFDSSELFSGFAFVFGFLILLVTPKPNMYKTTKVLTKLGCLPTSASFSSLARRLFHLKFMDCLVKLST